MMNTVDTQIGYLDTSCHFAHGNGSRYEIRIPLKIDCSLALDAVVLTVEYPEHPMNNHQVNVTLQMQPRENDTSNARMRDTLVNAGIEKIISNPDSYAWKMLDNAETINPKAGAVIYSGNPYIPSQRGEYREIMTNLKKNLLLHDSLLKEISDPIGLLEKISHAENTPAGFKPQNITFTPLSDSNILGAWAQRSTEDISSSHVKGR